MTGALSPDGARNDQIQHDDTISDADDLNSLLPSVADAEDAIPDAHDATSILPPVADFDSACCFVPWGGFAARRPKAAIAVLTFDFTVADGVGGGWRGHGVGRVATRLSVVDDVGDENLPRSSATEHAARAST